jgi:hypothetical protein
LLISPRVYYVLVPVAVVAFLYFVYSGRLRPGAFMALGFCAFALLAAYDGILLGAREYARAHDGHVTTGVVVSKTSATGLRRKEGSPGQRWWHRRLAFRAEGFGPHDMLGRLVLTGSLRAWMIDYRYECQRPRGCFGRDFVPEARWRELYPGQTVNVCRGNTETESSRLEDNPQWQQAVVNIATAGALLLLAGLTSGHLKWRRPRYLTVPAVVTAIEQLRSGDEPAWRLKFAYFDAKGEAHEGADEVVVATWKAGDEGLAVFPPDQPELATFRPVETA